MPMVQAITLEDKNMMLNLWVGAIEIGVAMPAPGLAHCSGPDLHQFPGADHFEPEELRGFVAKQRPC
jgi:hypothetical protein